MKPARRFTSDSQASVWHQISASINRRRPDDVSVIAEILRGTIGHRTHAYVIISIQETKSWDVPNPRLPGYGFHGSTVGLATLLVSQQCCKIKRSWRHEERCTVDLIDDTLVMTVYAPDAGKDLEQYEACISSVLKVLREGRRGGAKKFFIAGDLNVELGMMCTDESDNEKLNEMYGPLCWHEFKHDPGHYKLIMWYSIMKEFNCKVSSTWSRAKVKEEAFTHRQQGDAEKKKEIATGLHYRTNGRKRHNFYMQRAQGVGYMGPLSDPRTDTRRRT